MIALCYQTKTPTNFWCKQRLNLRSLIQPSKTLLVKLTRTHYYPSLKCTYYEYKVMLGQNLQREMKKEKLNVYNMLCPKNA